MNIIFGKLNADQLKDKYTVLELDRICLTETGSTETAYCVVENINLDQIPMIQSMQNLHQDLIIKYQTRNWTTCVEIIKRLRGFWNGELDSYYDNLEQRVRDLIDCPPGPDWTPVLQR